MKQLKSRITTEQTTAQQALDEIIQLEIELAQMMADAQDKALEKISNAESEMDAVKKDTLKKTRIERDQLQRKGLTTAQQTAHKYEQEAAAAAEQFQSAGQKFIQEAASRVLSIILPSGEEREV